MTSDTQDNDGLRAALEKIVALCNERVCPNLDRPTEFALSQAKGERLNRVRGIASLALTQATGSTQP